MLMVAIAGRYLYVTITALTKSIIKQENVGESKL